jgi:ankyrin repeat protein
MRASRRASLAGATALLDAGADPDARVSSWGDEVDVAYFACSSGNLTLLELLLARGADPHAVLASAVWHEDRTLAETALRHGAEPDRARAGDRPLLNELVRWGQFEHARWLLAHGASPNVPDPRGATAMHQAATRGNAAMLRDLLAAGGDPRHANVGGRSAFDLVTEKGDARLLAVLMGKPESRRSARRRKA